MVKYKDEILDHEYDGIQEMDNSVPRWWLYLFILTILWSFIYMMYYHVLKVGYLQEDLYLQEMDPNYVRIAESDAKILGLLPEYHSPYYNPKGDFTPRLAVLSSPKTIRVRMTAESDTTTYVAINNPDGIEKGRKSFIKYCSQCHGKLGQGGVGPNLTDIYWLHGADFTAIVKSIKYGYPSRGMQAWLGSIDEEGIIKVASFAESLKGTNPPDAKGPQGEPVN